jgi:hypothetical protein
MSKYIEHLEKQYNDGEISIDQISKLRQEYNKLSAYDKGNLDIKHLKKEADSKNEKPETKPKVIYQEQVVNLLVDQNSKLSTIKGILQFYLFLTIISIIATIVIFGNN